jgi:predicted nucleic acid-binding protein
MNKTVVLDSFAVLALLCNESGGKRVKEILRKSTQGDIRVLMTWVNIGEIAYIVERRWSREHVLRVVGMLEATNIEIIEVGRELTMKASQIKAGHALAFADAFAAALAIKEQALLVTGDAELKQLEGMLDIEWL